MSDLPAMTKNHGSRGFMTLRDQIFVLALMAVIYALLVPVIELFPSEVGSIGV